MRYSFISAAIVALVSSVLAQTAGFDAITSPTQDQNINAGSSFEIVWEPAGVTGTVTISLLQGATFTTLQVGPVVAASIDNTLGKFTYTVPSSSSFATYGFQIVLDSTAKDPNPTFQYSKPFHIVGGSSSASGSGSISASATGSGSSSGTTTTVHLSTNPSYTSSVASSTSTSNSSIPSSTKTVSTSSSGSSASLANITTSTSSSVSTTLKTTSTGTKTSATSTGSSSTSSSATAATNAAVANIATGGMAMIGGLVLALAL